MSRAAEKILAIISAVFTGIAIIISFAGLSLYKMAQADPDFHNEIEKDLMSDPTIGSDETALILSIIDLFGVFIWAVILGLIISFILTIIGIVVIWKNKRPKLAGISFIIAGLLAGILMPTSILLYIAGILCLTRKPPIVEKSIYQESSYEQNSHDDSNTMRPL
ncbi:DUF4064 domain-containing protein [Sporosarcina siberiensis]|uniref:DUF4064 domain-containing protein n=1 Tax=Sporosarcina siberiensis TaxID=1365606 RepID=A0ABW4SE57_9BACL